MEVKKRRKKRTYTPSTQRLFTDNEICYIRHAVNVEAAQASPASLLHWVRRILAVRKTHPVFGLGDFVVAHADNPAVLAYSRHAPEAPTGARSVLCVANLSDGPQSAILRQVANGVKVRMAVLERAFAPEP